MKTLRFFSGVVLLTFMLLFGVTISYAQPPDFIGDGCWSFTTTDGTSGILRLGVTVIGSGAHYALNGVFTTNDPFFAESTVSGSGEVLSDGFLHATLSRSMFDGEGITHSVIHAALDNTLSGAFDEAPTFIDANLASQNAPESGYRRGDLTWTSCP